MDFISNNWEIILGAVVAVAVAIALIILYRKNKITEEYIQLLADYLDTIDDGDGIVSLLAAYAKRAVLAVEQMVKAGVLPKTNDARKDMAMRIVAELATADGVELNEADKAAADNLIESEVFELKRFRDSIRLTSDYRIKRTSYLSSFRDYRLKWIRAAVKLRHRCCRTGTKMNVPRMWLWKVRFPTSSRISICLARWAGGLRGLVAELRPQAVLHDIFGEGVKDALSFFKELKRKD